MVYFSFNLYYYYYHHHISIDIINHCRVTDERPLPSQLHNANHYPNPLDEVDGAARVLQPLWRSEALRRVRRASRTHNDDDHNDDDDVHDDHVVLTKCNGFNSNCPLSVKKIKTSS